ncbi:MAG: energy-coupling factor transporter transmembrane component T [Oscillospiraceae bacterium]
MTDTFSTYHPVVNFLYFGLVLVFSMCFMHPLCLLISLSCGFLWSVYLGGRKALRFNLAAMLPMVVLMALINPVFSHRGATILAYFPNGNPLTLESILYGLAAAVMLGTVILWFSCYNQVMTSDKFVYLFGRIIPALSLILSMVLRFVPKFKAQFLVVSHAQKCVGRDSSNGGVFSRVRHAIRILSIMVTWSLENAIETADSMKSRGYGLSGRTAFSIYRFDGRDKTALCFTAFMGALVLVLAWKGELFWRYYPTLRGAPLTLWSCLAFLCYLSLCAMPLILDRWEDRKWKHIASST